MQIVVAGNLQQVLDFSTVVQAVVAMPALDQPHATRDQHTKRPDRLEHGSPIQPDGSVDMSHPSVRDSGGRLTLRIFNCKKPVIGAINGAAVGIG